MTTVAVVLGGGPCRLDDGPMTEAARADATTRAAPDCPGGAGRRPVLRSYDLLGVDGKEIDILESLARYQRASPMEVGEHRDMGARRTETVETACEPIDLGVFANQQYRLKEVADGRVEYGVLTYLVADLTDSHPR